MPLLPYDVARAIGVTRDAPDELVAERALRSIGVSVSGNDLSRGAARWFSQLVVMAGDQTWWEGPRQKGPAVVEALCLEAMRRLSVHTAPQVLAVIAPTQLLPARPADKNGLTCRAFVREHLPPLIARLLKVVVEEQELAPHDVDIEWEEDDRYTDMATRNNVDPY